ncbi:hypothetical protein ACSBR2_030003 [Camellia fascicularis]
MRKEDLLPTLHFSGLRSLHCINKKSLLCISLVEAGLNFSCFEKRGRKARGVMRFSFQVKWAVVFQANCQRLIKVKCKLYLSCIFLS